MADALDVLLQLHRQSVETERLELVAALDRWDAAVAVATAARRSIAGETEVAGQTGGDDLVEAFAAWLAQARAGLAVAEAAEADAEGRVVRQRAGLAAARASTRAAESMLERQAAATLLKTDRAAQRELDEAGARRFNRPQPDR